MSAATQTRELSTIDKLAETEAETNSDGTVNVEIESWNECDDGVIEVWFVTPTGTVESEKMQFPQPGEGLRDNKFYRLVRGSGYEMRNADLLEGETMKAIRTGSDWRLQTPDISSPTEKGKSVVTEAIEWVESVNWYRAITTTFWIVSVTVVVLSVIALLL